MLKIAKNHVTSFMDNLLPINCRRKRQEVSDLSIAAPVLWDFCQEAKVVASLNLNVKEKFFKRRF